MNIQYINLNLTDLEEEIIKKILNNEIEGFKEHEMSYPTVAYAVWFNTEENRIEQGRVRWGTRTHFITQEGRCSSLSCSPFPGAWTDVRVDRIIRIRHHKAF